MDEYRNISFKFVRFIIMKGGMIMHIKREVNRIRGFKLIWVRI